MTQSARDIWLTNLKFTDGFQDEESEDVPQSKAASETYTGTSLLKGQAGVPRTYDQPELTKPNPYDRLAGDKPGEELTSDSTIWKLYASEAKEHDNEFVSGKSRNLDMMLVLATLFSAILASFLLDSKNMMQPDAADISNTLLMRIAERLENPNMPFTPVDISAFAPSFSARWINGLWFTSLAFSLSAALIAMLAKEWLDAFVTSRPRPAHPFTVVRQARFDALHSWGALNIIDYLPLFLHISLLMFSLGLVVYLYTAIDKTIAAIVALTTGTTALFYVVTNILGTLYEVSPFRTQLSHSTRRILRFISHHWQYAEQYKHKFSSKQRKSQEKTVEQDLLALRWLADNSRDQLVGDSAYHALSGLNSGASVSHVRNAPQAHTSLTPSQSPDAPGDFNPASNQVPPKEASTKVGRKERLITSMFIDVCQRLGKAPEEARELEVSCGASVARFATTLPCLVNYLLSYPDRNTLIELSDARRRKLDLEDKRFDPPKQALDALDSILNNNCPPFTADAYAWITSAELKLVTDIALSMKFTRNSQMPMGDSGTRHVRQKSTTAETLIAFTQPVIEPRHISTVTYFELRARYSRSLARASFQMLFHSNNMATMNNFPLISLLQSLEVAATCNDLNETTGNPPKRSLSTHHPQSPGPQVELPNFRVFLVGAGDSYKLQSGEIGDRCGLIAGILGILGTSGARNAPGVELAAAKALNSIAPMLIKQLLGLSTRSGLPVEKETGNGTSSMAINDKANRNSTCSAGLIVSSPVEEVNMSSSSPRSVTPSIQNSRAPGLGTLLLSEFNDLDWPLQNINFSITHWSLAQMIVLGAFAKSQEGKPGIGNLLELSLAAFNHRFQYCFPRSTAFSIATTYRAHFEYIFNTSHLAESSTAVADSSNSHLLQILALKDDHTVYSTILMHQQEGPSQLLKIMQSAAAPPDTIGALLEDISDAAEKHWSYFSEAQNTDDSGFSRLLKLGGRHEYRPSVARCIFDIMQTAATPAAGRPQTLGITAAAIPVFFEAVRFVLKHYASDPRKPLDLEIFVDNMFEILRPFSSEHHEVLNRHVPRKEVKVYLDTISKSATLKTKVQRDFKWFKKTPDNENRSAPKEQVQPKHEAEYGDHANSAQHTEPKITRRSGSKTYCPKGFFKYFL